MLIFFIILAYYQISNNAESSQLVSSIFPVAYAANTNLFVSAENSQFDNYMSGPQVIEVVVIDSNISDTNVVKGEPDVKVNGKTLRMVQAIDGNWYGYFADRSMAQTADSTVTKSGTGLDFGTFCANNSVSGTVSFTDTAAIAIPGTGGSDGLAPPLLACIITPVADQMNVLRETKEEVAPNGPVPRGQIGLGSTGDWPIIQLYNLNPTGNVVIQYNKGGGTQTTTLTFDTVANFAKLKLDRATYTQGSQVQVTITNPWFNVDPTDEDSWTFETVGDISTNYEVFNENGAAPGANFENTDGNLLTNQLTNLMCQNYCKLELNPDVQNQGFVVTLQDNNDSQLSGDPLVPIAFLPGKIGGVNDPTTFTITPVSGGSFVQSTNSTKGSVPITLTEQGPNSGIFGTYDESDKSVLRITTDAKRGNSASFEYHDSLVTILVGFNFATIDIKPIDAEWSSGEEIPLSLVDGDANKNSRADEDLDLNNPDVSLIPALRTGTPNTLSSLTAATLDGNAATFTVQKFSDRALLTTRTPAIIADGDTLSLTFGTTADFFHSTPIDQANFHGYALFNYDVKSLKNIGNIEDITSVDITLAGVSTNVVPGSANTFDNQPLQGLILLNTDAFKNLAPDTPLIAVFTINRGVLSDSIAQGTILPVVADIFGYGFINDGRETDERIANQIIRLELEETGDNTSTFDGTLEYIMLNQLTILDPVTYTSITPISNTARFVVIDDFDDGDSPRVNYLDLGADGVSTQISDQQAAPTHSGVASFIKNAGTVTVTLQDLDLNVDSDLVDIYTVVTPPTDSNFDVVGDAVVANGGTSIELSNGDQLGRLLDVTFDDLQWKTPAATSACLGPLVTIVGTNTGLGATGFSLIETSKASGIFTGDFQVPTSWCRPGATTPESVIGLELEVNYVDFRNEFGEFIEVDPPNKYELKLDSGSFTPPRGIQIGNIINSKTPYEQENFFFLQTTHYLDRNEIKNLENKGITLMDFLDGFVYVASANDIKLMSFPFGSHPEIRSAIPIDPPTKLDSNIKTQQIPPWVFEKNTPGSSKKVVVMIFFHKPISQQKIVQILSPFNVQVGSTIQGLNAVYALMSFNQLEDLSKHSAVKFIRYQDHPLEPEISEAKRAANIATIQGPDSSLKGNGVVVLIFDNSKIKSNRDFGTRLIPIDSDCCNQQNHATHVAGVLGGGGTNSAYQGVAPMAKILSYGSTANAPIDPEIWAEKINDLEDSFIAANRKLVNNNIGDRIDLMNISLGQPTDNKGWDCKYHGNYTATSESLDKLVYGYSSLTTHYKKIIITKSAGNEGLGGCMGEKDYDGGFGTIASPASAKNPIVVGSIDSDLYSEKRPNVISSFSSVGPTDDGRIKPDLVAPGAHNSDDYSETQAHGIESIDSSSPTDGVNVYTPMSGTSFSAPLVGGIIALMEEKWENKFSTINNPTHLEPHTAKAILIHTAEDLGNLGPDYKYGWGLVNGEKAIKLISDSVFLDATVNSISNLNHSNTIIQDSFFPGHTSLKKYKLVLSNPSNLKLTLVWDDPPSTPEGGTKKLRSDLDLGILRGNVSVAKTFLLAQDQDHLNVNAGLGPDRTNNVEMIKTLQGEGTLEIIVVPHIITYLTQNSRQDFTLIVSVIPTPLNLQLNPLSPYTIKYDEQLTIESNLVPSMSNVKYSITDNQPVGASINEQTGIFTWIPTIDQKRAEPYTFHIQATKGMQLDKEEVKVTVVPEFGKVTMMILVVLITSIVLITAKTRVIPRF